MFEQAGVMIVRKKNFACYRSTSSTLYTNHLEQSHCRAVHGNIKTKSVTGENKKI